MGEREGTAMAGRRVRSDSRLFGPVAGVVLGPVRGDPRRVWVRWERALETWGGPVASETTVPLAQLEMIGEGDGDGE